MEVLISFTQLNSIISFKKSNLANENIVRYWLTMYGNLTLNNE